MIKNLWIALYAGVMAPLLGLAVRRMPELHRVLSKPLLTGPFREQRIVRDIQDAVYAYEGGVLDEEAFIERVSGRMCRAVEDGEMDEWVNRPVAPGENLDIVLARCLGYAPLRWWYLKLHFMAKGNVHGLHAHRNVLSTQVVARGSLRVREYDLEGMLEDNPTKLRLRRDAVVRPVNGFVSTDRVSNVHGFEPVDAPAVRFQFYLRGHTGVREMLRPRRGRLYVHPLEEPAKDGTLMAELGEAGKAGES